MSIAVDFFGIASDKREVMLYKLKNSNGMEAHVTNIGAALVRLIVPGKNGRFDDVVLGFDNVEGYEKNSPCFGAFVGRNANRIKDAKVIIDGVTYELEKNEGNNNLHSGSIGYARTFHEASIDENTNTVVFHRQSPHLEQGFPGTLDYKVSYTLTEDNALRIEYHAVSDQDTVVNFTNHSYFNLKGHKVRNAMDHELMIDSSYVTHCDKESIPDGTYIEVAGTPRVFRNFLEIGKEIDADYAPLREADGYDHNYVLDNEQGQMKKAAVLREHTSNRTMEVYTNTPGIQIYTANGLNQPEDASYKDNGQYHARDAVCLETQFYPNACNIKKFPSSILKAGETYDYTTIYKFV